MVVLLPEVEAYMNSLVTTLYEKEYFGFKEAARQYVRELYDDIRNHLPYRPHKPAPPHFDRYGKGMYYAAFKKSKHTEWYTFFTKYDYDGEIVYLIRYLTNNHVAAQHL